MGFVLPCRMYTCVPNRSLSSRANKPGCINSFIALSATSSLWCLVVHLLLTGSCCLTGLTYALSNLFSTTSVTHWLNLMTCFCCFIESRGLFWLYVGRCRHIQYNHCQCEWVRFNGWVGSMWLDNTRWLSMWCYLFLLSYLSLWR